MTNMTLQDYHSDWLKVRVEFKTKSEALKAVERNGDALQYVESKFFNIK